MNRYTIDLKIHAKLADWLSMNYTNKWERQGLSETYLYDRFVLPQHRSSLA